MTDIDTGLHYPLNLHALPVSWHADYVRAFSTEVQSGFACGQHSADDIGVAHLRPMNVSRNGAIDLSEIKYVPVDYDDRRLKEHDVLFNNTNSPELIGKTAHINHDGVGLAFSNHMTRVRFPPPVNPKFAAYQLHYLWMARYYLHRCVKHVNQASISSRDFERSIPFVAAPINEQDRIVAKIEELFSELDKGVESLKTAREQLKVYRQAVLKHAFEGKLTEQWREENKDRLETADQLLARIKREREARYEQQVEQWKSAVGAWEAKGKPGTKPRKPSPFKRPREITADEMDLLPTIPDSWQFIRLCEIAQIGSGMSVSGSRKVDDPIEVAYLRVANVQRGFLDLSEIKYMNIEKSQLTSLQLQKWDVLFNEGGDRDKLGRGWIWQSEVTPCITQNHVFRASPYIASEFNAKIISHWGNTFGQRYFEQTGKQTTNLASINKTVLSEFPAPLIPSKEQGEICNQIDRVMTILDVQDQEVVVALEQADLLRQSILKRAFSGQLVAQDPNDEPASVLLERIKAEKAALEKNNRKKRKVAA